jgi:hypothetical protein
LLSLQNAGELPSRDARKVSELVEADFLTLCVRTDARGDPSVDLLVIKERTMRILLVLALATVATGCGSQCSTAGTFCHNSGECCGGLTCIANTCGTIACNGAGAGWRVVPSQSGIFGDVDQASILTKTMAGPGEQSQSWDNQLKRCFSVEVKATDGDAQVYFEVSRLLFGVCYSG